MKAETRALLTILLVAAGLRLWGLGFGLPAVAHDDEWQYCATAASCLERGTVTVRTADRGPYLNPTGFTFLVALAELPVDAVATGGHPGGEGMRARYRAARGRYHLAGRVVSVLAGVLAVAATWWVGRGFLGARPALLAAALLALSPLHVRDSHFAVNDVTAGALMLGAVGALLTRGGPGGAALAGLLGGAAAGTKYSAGLLLPLLFARLCLTPGLSGDERARRLVLLGLGAAGGFLLAFPAALLDFQAFLASFREQASFGSAPWPGQDPGPVLLLHARTLVIALGPLGLLLGALGLLRLVRARRVVLAGYPALHLLVFLPLPLFFARLDLPLLPFLCLAAGAAVRALRGARPWALLALVLLLSPALTASRIDALLARPDTRADLHAWLEAQLPPEGAPPLRVAVDAGVVRFLPLGPDGGVDPRLQVYVLGRGRDPADPAALLASLRKSGYRDVVLTDLYSQPDPALARFAALLETRAPRVLEVGPGRDGGPVGVAQAERYGPWDHAWSRARPGPWVRVFALD